MEEITPAAGFKSRMQFCIQKEILDATVSTNSGHLERFIRGIVCEVNDTNPNL